MAKLKKKGNYVDPNWVLKDVMCTGKGWDQDGKKPCYSVWDLDSGDILTREHTSYGDNYPTTYYGFVCPECKCFTELDENLISSEIKKFCHEYRKVKDSYDRLRKEGKIPDTDEDDFTDGR